VEQAHLITAEPEAEILSAVYTPFTRSQEAEIAQKLERQRPSYNFGSRRT
jgi:hypothetical protein